MNLAERKEFIKASPAIQIQSRITHLQRKAWNILLANAYDELPKKALHRVSVIELGLKLGFYSGNMDYLKEVLEGLVDCTVKWNILEKDKEQEWGAASLLASVRINEGICTYEFPQPLRIKLYNPRVYAKLNLRLQNAFRSKYALILWEICFDYFDRARQEGETPFIPLEKFKVLMGLDKADYPDFKVLNRNVIRVSIREINEVTNYHLEVEQKRLGRKIAELKFRITKKVAPVTRTEREAPLTLDIHDLPRVAIELVQAGVDRKMALQIANKEWGFVAPEKLPPPGTYPDFLGYVAEKIEMSLSGAGVKNRGGFILEAIRENYEDPEVQKARELRAEKIKQKALEDLTAEFKLKRDTLIRQAVHADPHLVEAAAGRVQAYIVRQRLEEHDTVMEVYQKGGMVAAEINAILAEEFCQDLLARVVGAYEDEKARILAEVGA